MVCFMVTKSKQIQTLLGHIKQWSPDRDIIEVRDMLITLRDLTKHPLTYIAPKDIAKSRKYKIPRQSSLWGVDDKGYCLIKRASTWDFTIQKYEDFLGGAIEAGGTMAKKYYEMMEAQIGVPARERHRMPWRYSDAMMELVEEAMELDKQDLRSVQAYIDHLMFQDFKKKGLG